MKSFSTCTSPPGTRRVPRALGVEEDADRVPSARVGAARVRLGQTTVEFAMSIGIFLSILLVGFQMGLIIIQHYALMHVTRESARWVATHYDSQDAQVIAHVKTEAARLVTLDPANFDLPAGSIVVTPACNWGSTPPDPPRCLSRNGEQQIQLATTYSMANHIFLPPALLTTFGISTTARQYAVAMQQESSGS